MSDDLKRIDEFANGALHLWDLPEGATARRINVSENVTYLVEAEGWRSVLRLHREGYHSRRAIECELAWLDALRSDTSVETAKVICGHDGGFIQMDHLSDTTPRFMVMFEFLEGDAPDESQDLSAGFEELGRIAAECHTHVLSWQKPEKFKRLIWDDESVFGEAATWGDWRDAPGVTTSVRTVLEQAEASVRSRLSRFGRGPERFNLIHADMRLANLLVGDTGTRLIDFDDCGLGWFLYDFAAAISFIEDDPQVPALKAAWLRGYRSLRAISAEEEAEIDTFVMLRRFALLAWIGSHIDAPEPQALAPTFADGTKRLAEAFLETETAG